jgi:hypothetical protein
MTPETAAVVQQHLASSQVALEVAVVAIGIGLLAQMISVLTWK